MDYYEIINALEPDRVITLMKRLGADRYIDKGKYIIFPTICHNINPEEASMKLYFYKNTKLFTCYTGCGNMSIFKFLKEYYRTRQLDYNWYEDVYLVAKNCTPLKMDIEGFVAPTYKSLRQRYNMKPKMIKLPEYPSNVLDCFVTGYYAPEWLEDGISKESMDKFDIRYSISQNKIIIPHRDVRNRLVGIRGRALDPMEAELVGKYMPVKVEQTWYKHPLSMNLYGLNLNRKNIKRTRICYLFEGEKSVLQLDGFNMVNCGVAACGSNLNVYQVNLLLKHCAPQEIVICFDKEDGEGEDAHLKRICEIGRKYSEKCNFSYVRDMHGYLDLKDSPTDKGEEIFRQLLRERKKII